MKRDEIDEILHSKLYDYSETDSVPSWEQMEVIMNSRKALSSLGETNKGVSTPLKRSLWVRYSATAAAVIAAIGLSIYQFNYHENVIMSNLQPSFIENNSSAQPSQSSQPVSNQNSTIKDPVINRLFASVKSIKPITKQELQNQTQTKTDESSTLYTEQSESAQQSHEPQGSHKQTPQQRKQSEREQAEIARQYARIWNEPERSNRRNNRGWAANIYASNTPSTSGGSSQTSAVMGVSTLKSPLVEINALNNQMASMNNVTYATSMPKLKHKVPLSFGFDFSRQIGKRTSISVGISYSYLESNGTMEGAFKYKYKQRLHYIGIPVSVRYAFIQKPQFEVYSFAGVMAEKAVSAKATTTLYKGDAATSHNTINLKANGLMWSGNIGLGMGYDFVKNFGIYVEPSVGYYIENDSQPASYRTDNSLTFNLKAGFRYKF